MLKRRSIKTKLGVWLVLLLMTVISLAISSLWGLRRYRALAVSVSQATLEVGLASGLDRSAESLREHATAGDSDIPVSGLRSGENFLQRHRGLENMHLQAHRQLFEHNLQHYEERLEEFGQTPLLMEPDVREQHLVEIRAAFVDVEADLLGVTSFDPDQTRLKNHLDQLVETTRRHSETLGEGMRQLNADVNATYRTWKTVTLISFASALILVAVLLWSFWTMLVQPFHTLLEGSRLVARGQFEHRIDLGTEDEINELAVAMNEMCAKFQSVIRRLENFKQNLEQQVRDRTNEVIRSEQLASVGFLAAGVAHEINNPLTAIAWAAESLESHVGELSETDQPVIHEGFASALQQTLRQIQGEAFRCKGITDRLLDFSRMSEVRREPTDLGALVKDVVDLVSKVGEFRCKQIDLECRDEVIADVSSHQIRQVVLNLLTNALESVDDDGRVAVTVRKESEQAYISVVDTGCGMSREVLQHLFEPFFTRRRDGSGTGLGLSITYRIVSQHGGKLVPHSDGEGLGSKMELWLPLKTDQTDEHQLLTGTIGASHESYQAA